MSLGYAVLGGRFFGSFVFSFLLLLCTKVPKNTYSEYMYLRFARKFCAHIFGCFVVFVLALGFVEAVQVDCEWLSQELFVRKGCLYSVYIFVIRDGFETRFAVVSSFFVCYFFVFLQFASAALGINSWAPCMPIWIYWRWNSLSSACIEGKTFPRTWCTLANFHVFFKIFSEFLSAMRFMLPFEQSHFHCCCGLLPITHTNASLSFHVLCTRTLK